MQQGEDKGLFSPWESIIIYYSTYLNGDCRIIIIKTIFE